MERPFHGQEMHDTYNAASISYTAKQDKTAYVSVTRKQYVQNVYVKYQDANGNYSGDWGLAKSQNLYYGLVLNDHTEEMIVIMQVQSVSIQ